MKKTLLCKVDEQGVQLSIIDFEHGGDLDLYYQLLDCDTIDIVEGYGLNQTVDIICDDEGLLKEKPYLNPPASIAYGILEHGQPIVGNALIVKPVPTPDGIEEGGFTEEELEKIMQEIAVNTSKYITRRFTE